LWIHSSYPPEWLYERENESAKELVGVNFLEEFESPGLILNAIPMKQLREVLSPHKIKVKSKDEAIRQIITVAPEVYEREKKKYWALRFNNDLLHVRGQIRNYLKPRFPEFFETEIRIGL
jgi:hypothetical protein